MKNSHINKRLERYYINSGKEGFLNKLKGLSTIELCITELCTRKCGFCPRSDSKVYKNQKLFMTIDTIKSIVQKCIVDGFDGDFHVSGFGESFTHPEFNNLMCILRDGLPNNHIVLTTNGDLLTDENIQQVIKRNFNKVIVSCYDGPTDKLKFIDMFERNGFFNHDIRELWYKPEESTEELINRNNFNNRSGAVSVELTNNNKHSPCYLPFYKLVIDWNGNILLCCNDWKRNHTGFGNINVNSLHEIWYGTEFVIVREQLKNGNRIGKACINCNISGTLIGKESVDILTK